MKNLITKTDTPDAETEQSLKRYETGTLQQDMKPILHSVSLMAVDKQEVFLAHHCEQVFTRNHGSERPLLIEVEELSRAKEESAKALKVAEKAEADTPRFKKAVPESKDGSYRRIKLKEWRIQDIVLVLTLLPFMLLMMFTASVNVYVNIMAVPTKVFSDGGEWKAALIAALAASSGVVLKQSINMFQRQSHQEVAKRVMIALAVMLVIYWLWLLDGRFAGLGAKPDITRILMGESGGEDHFLFIQILTELIVSAVIFQWLTDLMDTYSPTKLIPNADYPMTVERREQAHKRHQNNLIQLKEAQLELDTFRSSKAEFLGEQLAALALANQRHQSLYQ